MSNFDELNKVIVKYNNSNGGNLLGIKIKIEFYYQIEETEVIVCLYKSTSRVSSRITLKNRRIHYKGHEMELIKEGINTLCGRLYTDLLENKMWDIWDIIKS